MNPIQVPLLVGFRAPYIDDGDDEDDDYDDDDISLLVKQQLTS